MKFQASIFSEMTGLALHYGAINLAQGFPEFGPPEGAVEAYRQALADGRNQYAPMAGWPALREALSQVDQRRWGATHSAVAHPDTEITIVPGATVGLYAVFLALLEPGDEAVVLEPAYDSYGPALRRAGANVVGTSFEAPDWDRVLGPKTRLIVINSPHNPTGGVWERADWNRLAEALERYPRVVVVSDEAYEWMVFDGRPPLSVRQIDALRSRSVRILSLGKTFHATGWKIGAVIAPAELTDAVRQVYQFLAFSANTPAQVALASYLHAHPEYPVTLAAFFQSKRDRLAHGLEAGGWRVKPCAGSYFLTLALENLGPEESDLEWAKARVRDAGVATVPLAPFFEHIPQPFPSVRLCFAKHDATLDRAIDLLNSWKFTHNA
jgi:methionine aminotransferase